MIYLKFMALTSLSILVWCLIYILLKECHRYKKATIKEESATEQMEGGKQSERLDSIN